MGNPTTGKRLIDIAAGSFYGGLLETEDLGAFEAFVASGTRALGAAVLRSCLERFDSDLRLRAPRGWSPRGRVARTLVTLLGEVTFERTVFADEHGRRRVLLDELIGVAPRSRLSPCAFLWVASHAAELSYRKTAAEFEELTGARISHVTVMNVVHREGALLEEGDAEFSRGGRLRVSQDVLFVESDGLWVHLQEGTHRKEALPRFLYEQGRKTKSFELKIAAVYAGKAEVAPGRRERGGLCLTCLDGDADAFWERTWRMLTENYEQGDVERIAVGGDGASWCGPERLERMAPAGCVVDHAIDPFHVMQKIARAFPREDSPEREWAVNLAVRGRGKRLAEMCRRAAAAMRPGRARDKVRELASYAGSNAAAIRPPAGELGTMEGTNAHVGAARLKGQGRSWSRRGAESMCRIRCALATGRRLLAPPPRAWFTRAEVAALEAALPRSASQVPQAEGAGWEPPHRAGALGKSVEISLSRRR